jgi:hypothetical protein
VAVGCVQIQAGGRPGRRADPDKQPFAAHHYRVVLDPACNEEEPADRHAPVPASDEHRVPMTERAPIDERPPSNDITKESCLSGQAYPAGPHRTMPLGERAERLVTMFEPAVLDAWFMGAQFHDGPPLRLILARPVQCNWVRDKFGDRLRRAFGDDMVFDFKRSELGQT